MGRNSTVISKKISKILGDVSESYPDLRISCTNNLVEIIGSLPVVNSGELLGRFIVRIEVLPGYPRAIPRVFEIGGKIPKVPGRHITPLTEEACVCLKDEWGGTFAKYPTVLDFINGPVRDFFVWQISYDYFDEDRLGGWSHGGKGRLEFYQEQLHTTDVEVIKKCLLHLAQKKYRPNWLCYCGSGKKVCQCHKVVIITLRSRISPELASSALKDISAVITGA